MPFSATSVPASADSAVKRFYAVTIIAMPVISKSAALENAPTKGLVRELGLAHAASIDTAPG